MMKRPFVLLGIAFLLGVAFQNCSGPMEAQSSQNGTESMGSKAGSGLSKFVSKYTGRNFSNGPDTKLVFLATNRMQISSKNSPYIDKSGQVTYVDTSCEYSFTEPTLTASNEGALTYTGYKVVGEATEARDWICRSQMLTYQYFIQDDTQTHAITLGLTGDKGSHYRVFMLD